MGWITCADDNSTGYILLSTDSGETWQQQFVYWQPIFDICMLNQDTGWAVGGDFIYYTTNGTFIPVGIDEKMPENKFITITPNPTNGIFTIKINYQLPIIANGMPTAQLQITNTIGKQILKSQITNHNPTIDISKQPPGVYFITFQYHINNQINSLTQIIIKL